MDWKQSLDKYLTTPPDDGFDSWCEAVVEAFSNQFYTDNSEWIEEYDGQCNAWMNKLFARGENPSYSAKVIEMAFRVYSELLKENPPFDNEKERK